MEKNFLKTGKKKLNIFCPGQAVEVHKFIEVRKPVIFFFLFYKKVTQKGEFMNIYEYI